MTRTIRTLIIEDSQDDADLLLRLLRGAGYDVVFRRVDTPEALGAALSESWDLILSDHRMPRFSAPAALAMVRERGLDVPFLIVSGSIGEELAVEAMKAGAHDYLIKGRLARLPAAVERELREAEMRRAHAEARRELDFLAFHDALTGLGNRPCFDVAVARSVDRAAGDGGLLAVLMISLERFRDIINTFGRETADAIILESARRLGTALGGGATLARLGPGVFGALLRGGEPAAGRAADAVLAAFRSPCVTGDLALEIDPCVGGALYPRDGASGRDLVHRADVALDQARAAGGGTFTLFRAETDPHKPRRLALLGELRRAIAEDQLFLEYQPKVGVRSGEVEGLEALVRWRHPALGVVPPAEFVPLAEQGGLAGPLTRWVLRAALRQLQAWERQGRELHVAVNVSARNLRDPAFLPDLEEALALTSAAPERLILEVTEHAVLQDLARALAALHRLRALGVLLSLDDFGTGYSSLVTLRTLPAAEIKIDQSFVRGMMARPADRIIVTATRELGHSLGMRVAAEGVESEAIWRCLAEIGCDTAQGYHLGRPAEARALAPRLRRGAPRRDAS
jgi:diguanylate cyclase (GGDEF)-like protein